ncbi:hypothetical protein D9757_000059 [Collybiopsis confluens]|uniref:GST N-terminal domain-containing protein n=1 Tax=Collybiopsis confluens TaxID=2823264 RepID=A0A8H5I2C9_9AGAR|nr:hypothetical protein D9757_000059 [Collybiopsis confluens]
MSPPVILYRYDTSPFSVKIDNILLLKNIAHSTVTVPNVLPRPEITELLGLTYRRIPILAIGNDIYCDTSLIASALERRFPPSAGFGSIFPPKKHGGSPDTGLLKAFTKHYADTVLFGWATVLLPWDRFPDSFLNDRRIIAPNLNVQIMMKSQAKAMSTLISNLTLINEQLQDGREWLFDTELPSLADVGLEFVFRWLRGFKNTPSLFDKDSFPYAFKWLDRMNKFYEICRKDFHPPAILSNAEAANLIASSPHEPYEIVGFNATDANRFHLVKDQVVSVTPDEGGLATVGKLVALNHEECVVETRGSGSSTATFRCHFPRIGSTIKAIAEHKL